MTGTVATAVADRKVVWAKMCRSWLGCFRSRATHRSYKSTLRNWEQFLAARDKELWQAERADAVCWKDEMEARGASASTIRQRMAAISSLYTSAMEFTTLTTGDMECPLINHNPLDGIDRPNSPAAAVSGLNPDEAAALLRAIPRDTVQGLRDFALFLFYLALGWRTSQVRTLRWSDFRGENGCVYVRRLVRDQEEWIKVPPLLWEVLKAYREVLNEPNQ